MSSVVKLFPEEEGERCKELEQRLTFVVEAYAGQQEHIRKLERQMKLLADYKNNFQARLEHLEETERRLQDTQRKLEDAQAENRVLREMVKLHEKRTTKTS